MPEIPEHLLKRSAERRKQLGLPTGEEGETEASATPAEGAEVEAPAAAEEAAPAAAAAAAAADTGDAITEDTGGVPAHLLERSRRRKAALTGGEGRTRAHDDRPRRPHAAPADRREVGLDPADPRRSPGQGPHLAAPARH